MGAVPCPGVPRTRRSITGVLDRPRRHATTVGTTASPWARTARGAAPDDDPEFLAGIRKVDDEHERTLHAWEADLRRREEELRRGTRGDGDIDPPRS